MQSDQKVRIDPQPKPRGRGTTHHSIVRPDRPAEVTLKQHDHLRLQELLLIRGLREAGQAIADQVAQASVVQAVPTTDHLQHGKVIADPVAPAAAGHIIPVVHAHRAEVLIADQAVQAGAVIVGRAGAVAVAHIVRQGQAAAAAVQLADPVQDLAEAVEPVAAQVLQAVAPPEAEAPLQDDRVVA